MSIITKIPLTLHSFRFNMLIDSQNLRKVMKDAKTD